MANEIVFDAKLHTYTVGKKRYISLTQALTSVGLIQYENLPPFYAERGSAIHLAVEYDVKGTLDEETLDSQILPYVEADRKFRKDTGIEILESEKRFVHEELGYAGTIDRVVRLNGRKGIIDVKGGWPAPWHALQLEGYRLGYSPLMPTEYALWNLYLRLDGTYKLVERNDPGDLLVWTSIINLVRWKRRKGIE